MQNTIRQTALTILTGVAIFAAVVLLSRVIGPIPFAISQTTTQKNTSFDVTGESELITVPDQAEVSVGISTRGATVAQAQEAANTVINNISNEVKNLGVKADDIKTTNYNINPEYDYNSERRPIIGYMVNSNLRIKTTELPMVNQIIDTATAQGANQVGDVQFTLSKEKRDELTAQAREEAIADAKANAEELARLSGMQLGRIINVYEQPPYNQPPMPYGGEVMMRAADAAQATAIEPGTSTFTYTVTVSYETH